jgi:hypothetical protein
MIPARVTVQIKTRIRCRTWVWRKAFS